MNAARVSDLPRFELVVLEFGGDGLKNGRDMSLKKRSERTLGEFDLYVVDC